MYNYQKQFKIQKLKTFQHIQTTYNYLFFCRYFDLKSSDLTALKSCLNQQNIKFTTIKQNLVQTKYAVKGQGALLLIYFQDFHQLTYVYNFLQKQEKLEPLFVAFQQRMVSILKIQKILHPTVSPLPYQLKSSVYNLYRTMANI